jgi:hypothetical protein
MKLGLQDRLRKMDVPHFLLGNLGAILSYGKLKLNERLAVGEQLRDMVAKEVYVQEELCEVLARLARSASLASRLLVGI